MLRRTVKIQLILFIALTLAGISYVSAAYIGLAKPLFDSNACTVKADFPDGGGIFTNAEVTFRGVSVGKVGAMTLIPGGVQVNLDIDNCSSPQIPVDTAANVTNLSVVGEQYVDLVPRTSKGPYVHGNGTVLAMKHNTIPVQTETLLLNLDKFLQSVPLHNLQVTVSELDNAFDGRGPALGTLLDATHELLEAALQPDNLANTISLIDNSSPVLSTQLDLQSPIYSWAHSLDLLSQQLKASNPDIEHLLNTGPGDLSTVQGFIKDNRTDLGVALANLSSLGQMVVQHIDGTEEILELYPALAAGGRSVVDQDGHAKLGLVLQSTPSPQDCGGSPTSSDRQGYDTTTRYPDQTSPNAPNVSAQCTAPRSDEQNQRGSQYVPGGDPISTSGAGQVYPRTVSNDLIGTSLMTPSKIGDASWLTLLTDGLH